MTDEDKVIFNLFYRLSRGLLTWKLLKHYLSTPRWVDLSGMYNCLYAVLSQC